MLVSIKLPKLYHRYMDKNITIKNGIVQLELSDGSTIRDVLKKLNISEKNAKILLVNSKVHDIDQKLNDQDHVFIFPPVAGG